MNQDKSSIDEENIEQDPVINISFDEISSDESIYDSGGAIDEPSGSNSNKKQNQIDTNQENISNNNNEDIQNPDFGISNNNEDNIQDPDFEMDSSDLSDEISSNESIDKETALDKSKRKLEKRKQKQNGYINLEINNDEDINQDAHIEISVKNNENDENATWHNCTEENCNYKSKRTSNLSRHYVKLHTTLPLEKRIDCCDIIFDKRFAFKQHKKLAHKDGKFQCLICNNTFVKRALLKRHQLVHNKKNAIKCENCVYATDHVSNMFRHCESQQHTSLHPKIVALIEHKKKRDSSKKNYSTSETKKVTKSKRKKSSSSASNSSLSNLEGNSLNELPQEINNTPPIRFDTDRSSTTSNRTFNLRSASKKQQSSQENAAVETILERKLPPKKRGRKSKTVNTSNSSPTIEEQLARHAENVSHVTDPALLDRINSLEKIGLVYSHEAQSESPLPMLQESPLGMPQYQSTPTQRQNVPISPYSQDQFRTSPMETTLRNQLAVANQHLVADRRSLIADQRSIVADRQFLIADQRSVVADQHLVADRRSLIADQPISRPDRQFLIADQRSIVTNQHLVADRRSLMGDQPISRPDQRSIIANQHLVADRRSLLADQPISRPDQRSIIANQHLVADRSIIANQHLVADRSIIANQHLVADRSSMANHPSLIGDLQISIADQRHLVADRQNVLAELPSSTAFAARQQHPRAAQLDIQAIEQTQVSPQLISLINDPQLQLNNLVNYRQFIDMQYHHETERRRLEYENQVHQVYVMYNFLQRQRQLEK